MFSIIGLVLITGQEDVGKKPIAKALEKRLFAGAILIVTAVELTQEDLELIKTTVNPQQIETVWIGDKVTTDIDFDLHISDFASEEEAAGKIKGLLQDRGIIFRLW